MLRVTPQALLLTTLAAGCSSEPPPRTVVDPGPEVASVVDGGVPADPGDAGAQTPPGPGDSLPALTGGTMALAPDGRVAVLDVTSGTLHLVEPVEGTLGEPAHVDPLDHPGRVAVDGEGRVHVVLRRAGALQTFASDLSASTRRPLCTEPRGIDVDGDELLVACASGELVRLDAAGGPVTRRLHLEPDLRDVVVTDDGRVHVSVFRSAELLTLDEAGVVVERRRPAAFEGTDLDGDPLTMLPHVAWRIRPLPGGGIVMAHQRHTSTPIQVSGATSAPGAPGGYSQDGGLTDCRQGVVEAAVTRFEPDGEVVTHSVAGTTMPLDIVVLDGDEVAVAEGARFPSAALRQTVAPRVMSFSAETRGDCPRVDIGEDGVSGQAAVALVRLPDGRVMSQHVGGDLLTFWYDGRHRQQSVPNPAAPALAQGFTVFHERSPAGVACASCHPEGGEDGHTWSFTDVGARRTQSLLGGIGETAPFHWSGDQAGMREIMEGTMQRMARHFVESEVAPMEAWLDAQPSPRGVREDALAVERGAAHFERSCASCHAGETLTNGETVDVGTGEPLEPFQVPSLRGVVYRAPYLHDGCAPTLEAIFDGTCGDPSRHADLSGVSAEGRADLFAYVRAR